jgi:23S rRNA (guanosine2251-2'-O)-methyltransferase
VYAVADGVQDPHNFGAMLRSAEVFGVEAFFISERGQAPVTSMAARSSAGAVNRVPIVRVPDLAALVDRLRERRIRVVGASEKAGEDLTAFDFTGPAAIVIGNEGSGIRPEVQARCDALLRIPQHGAIGSLNAAAAAAVFFYEMRRQRGTAAKPIPPPRRGP